MRASEFDLVEHSDWKRDPYYTPEVKRNIYLAIKAVQDVAQRRGIELTFKKHFFDQLFAQRAMSKISHDLLIDTFGRILNRGLHLFQGKKEGTSLVFYDPETNLNIPLVKVKKQRYWIPTVIRDVKWLGPEKKVTL